MVDWAKALEVFVVGFGGVFGCLVILMVLTAVTSKLFQQIDKMAKGKEE